MNRLPAAVRRGLVGTAYAVYYRLPPAARRRLVRLVAPTYTVGAVLLVRDRQTGRLLLIRQPGARGWSPPAGLLARGERPADGAVRELAEETGLRVPADQLEPAVPNAVVHPRGRVVDLVFHAAVPAATVTLRVDGVEVREAGWYDLTALPPLTRAAERLLGVYRLAGGGPAQPDGVTTGQDPVPPEPV